MDDGSLQLVDPHSKDIANPETPKWAHKYTKERASSLRSAIWVAIKLVCYSWLIIAERASSLLMISLLRMKSIIEFEFDIIDWMSYWASF